MPKYIFELSGENINLAKVEVLSATGGSSYRLNDNLLILDLESIKGVAKILGFTHNIYKLLFETKEKNIKIGCEKFDWNSVYKDSYRVTIIGKLNFSEKEIGSIIWDKINNPKVNLRNPNANIVLLSNKDTVYVTLLESKIDKSFLEMTPQTMPEHHPSALNPKMARAIINLSGIRKGQTLVDPFCGAGYLLIQAAMMGLKVVGYDIAENMIKKAERNLDHSRVRYYQLKQRDSIKLDEMVEYIISDLPYGISTKRENEQLYLKFIKTLNNILQKKAVLVFPDYFDCKKAINNTELIIENEFIDRVHKSLTRKIVIIKKK